MPSRFQRSFQSIRRFAIIEWYWLSPSASTLPAVLRKVGRVVYMNVVLDPPCGRDVVLGLLRSDVHEDPELVGSGVLLLLDTVPTRSGQPERVMARLYRRALRCKANALAISRRGRQ